MFDFREFKESDAEIILGWITDEKSFRLWSADKYKNYPAKAGDINAFYNELKLNGAMPLMFCDGKASIGHLVMRLLSGEPVKTVRFGFIIVDSSVRGKGYGKAMLNKALEFAIDKLGAERITLGVFDNNPKAHKCYESVGFKKCGESTYNIDDEEWICHEMEYTAGFADR